MPLFPRYVLLFVLGLAGVPAVADDGDPDPAFSGDGKAVFGWPSNYVQVESAAVAAFADGSVVTAGWVDNGNNNRDFAVARFSASGAVDASFGNQGSVVVPFDLVPGGNDRGVAVFAQTDGKVLVAGYAGIDTAPYVRPALLRLLPNGQPDAGFGTGGKQVVTSHPWGAGANMIILKAVQQRDGKIVLGGTCGNCPQGSPADVLLVRLLPNGSVDTGFGNQGWVSFGRIENNFYQEERLSDLAVDSTGRILVAGYTESPDDPNERRIPLIVCFNADGSLDTAYGSGGYALINLLGSWSADALAPSLRKLGSGLSVRRLFVALNLDATPAQTRTGLLVALNASGSLLTSFGTDGLVDLTRDEGVEIRALAVRDDNSVTAAGWIDRVGSAAYDFFIARTTYDGELDTTFDGNGVRSVPFDLTTNSYDQPTAMTLSAQRPLIAGNVQNLFGPTPWNTGVLRMQSDHLFASDLDR